MKPKNTPKQKLVLKSEEEKMLYEVIQLFCRFPHTALSMPSLTKWALDHPASDAVRKRVLDEGVKPAYDIFSCRRRALVEMLESELGLR
ncbi:hypothetical protein [Paracoccus sp. KR1-242]|uniref:hypothetical protein n=1 Tax=Paracoccus sp. KR1-242 TaxID=3410028 RepID=UPI003C096951